MATVGARIAVDCVPGNRDVPTIGSSRTMQRIFELSPIPLVLASRVFDDCPLILVNEPFLELSGFRRDDVIGRNCRFLQGPKSEATARAALAQAIFHQRDALVPITNYRRDGTAFRNLVFLFPIFDMDGRNLYMLGSPCNTSSIGASMSPTEHARVLDQILELNNPLLIHRDGLRISTSAPCVQLTRQHLDSLAPAE